MAKENKNDVKGIIKKDKSSFLKINEASFIKPQPVVVEVLATSNSCMRCD